jgi:hypothetical protein
MSLVALLDRLDKKYAWSFLGFALAIVLGALTIYTDFLRDPRPQLRFEIVSDASVLDVREKLGNLEILYDGLDIHKAQQSLRVIVLRVLNDGSQDILKNYFDESAPVGFRIDSGSLLRAELLSGSNSYLQDVGKLDLRPPNSAYLAPLILEAGEWLTIKILILHSEGVHPVLHPLGKVAGVREIRMLDSSSSVNEPSFLERAFHGGVWIQVARLFSYFLAFLLGFVAFVVLVTYISGAIAVRTRKRLVAQFKTRTRRALGEADEFILRSYIERDEHYLVALQRLVDDEVKRNVLLERFVSAQAVGLKGSSPDMNDIDDYLGVSSTGALPPWVWRGALANEVSAANFVRKGDAGWYVDPQQVKTLSEFMEFLEERRRK